MRSVGGGGGGKDRKMVIDDRSRFSDYRRLQPQFISSCDTLFTVLPTYIIGNRPSTIDVNTASQQLFLGAFVLTHSTELLKIRRLGLFSVR